MDMGLVGFREEERRVLSLVRRQWMGDGILMVGVSWWFRMFMNVTVCRMLVGWLKKKGKERKGEGRGRKTLYEVEPGAACPTDPCRGEQ
jgi:hypothetical protein